MNEDGTYTKGDMEEGTYTYEEVEYFFTDPNTNTTTTELRHKITLSGDFMEDIYYLISDGQILLHWDDDADDFYIYEDALED